MYHQPSDSFKSSKMVRSLTDNNLQSKTRIDGGVKQERSGVAESDFAVQLESSLQTSSDHELSMNNETKDHSIVSVSKRRLIEYSDSESSSDSFVDCAVKDSSNLHISSNSNAMFKNLGCLEHDYQIKLKDGMFLDYSVNSCGNHITKESGAYALSKRQKLYQSADAIEVTRSENVGTLDPNHLVNKDKISPFVVKHSLIQRTCCSDQTVGNASNERVISNLDSSSPMQYSHTDYYDRAVASLVHLQIAIEKLACKQLFPYNSKPLCLLLNKCDLLFERSKCYEEK